MSSAGTSAAIADTTARSTFCFTNPHNQEGNVNTSRLKLVDVVLLLTLTVAVVALLVVIATHAAVGQPLPPPGSGTSPYNNRKATDGPCCKDAGTDRGRLNPEWSLQHEK